MGLPVFNTGDAAPRVAWWVRLPRAPATEVRCRPVRPTARDRRRLRDRPSVEAVLGLLRPDVDGVDPARADGGRPRGRGRRTGAPRRRSPAPLATPRRSRPRRGRASTAFATAGVEPVINATGRHRPHEPRPGAVAERRGDRGRGAGLGLPAPRARSGDRQARGPRSRRRGPPRRADRRRGRPRHQQQRGRRRARGRSRRSRRHRRVARRARRDRRRRPHPRHRPAGRGASSSRSGRRIGPAPPTTRSRLASGRARAVLRVHPSNFAMAGFTEAPDAAEVAALAHEHDAIVIDDLGSGALLDTAAFGLAHEPMPDERLATGRGLVTFSGDKLVGGPQAGFIVGRADLIARIRRDPLARAMRPDRVTMAAVALTLGLYRAGRATTDIPVWRMIATPVTDLETRAERLVAALPDGAASVVDVRSTVGGGSLPGETLPSVALAVAAAAAGRFGDAAPGAVARGRSDRHRADRGRAGRPRPADRRPGPGRRARDAVTARAASRVMAVVIGTAGHIDHGKTTLLRALTGIDADRLPEERRRGMTIDVGYAHLSLDDGTVIDFVDVPGHDRLVGQHARRGRRDRCRDARRRGGRRSARPDPRAPRAARRAGSTAGPRRRDQDRRRRAERLDAVVDEVRALIGAGVPVVAASGVTGAGLDDVRTALVRLAAPIVRPGSTGQPRHRSGLHGPRPWPGGHGHACAVGRSRTGIDCASSRAAATSGSGSCRSTARRSTASRTADASP